MTFLNGLNPKSKLPTIYDCANKLPHGLVSGILRNRDKKEPAHLRIVLRVLT